MTVAEQIYEEVKNFPESIAQEVFDFAKFVSLRITKEKTNSEPSLWPDLVVKFNGFDDLQPFEQSRNELAPTPADPFA